jgi:hypothetical protein
VYQQLIANIQTNLVFYRRNRLLIAASLFIILVLGLGILPSMIFLSNTQRLEQLRTVFQQINSMAMLVTAGLGLLLVPQHIKDRSVKMVFTKPCRPETWLLSSFLSAALVAFVLYAGSFCIASVFSAVWGIPFPSGIAFISVNEFFQTVSLMAFITFLSVVAHPVLVVMFLLIFRESMIYQLKGLLAAVIKAGAAKAYVPLLKLLKVIADAAYMVLPTFNPYEEKTAKVYSSLRGSDADGNYLLLAIAYALAVTALFYFMTAYVLKKKRYV